MSELHRFTVGRGLLRGALTLEERRALDRALLDLEGFGIEVRRVRHRQGDVEDEAAARGRLERWATVQAYQALAGVVTVDDLRADQVGLRLIDPAGQVAIDTLPPG